MNNGGTMNTEATEKHYYAVRMANGGKSHLRRGGSSQTECSAWIANTRQYATGETLITCSKCAQRLNIYAKFYADAIAQGFTTEAK
jgi:hypothetical protein